MISRFTRLERWLREGLHLSDTVGLSGLSSFASEGTAVHTIAKINDDNQIRVRYGLHRVGAKGHFDLTNLIVPLP